MPTVATQRQQTLLQGDSITATVDAGLQAQAEKKSFAIEALNKKIAELPVGDNQATTLTERKTTLEDQRQSYYNILARNALPVGEERAMLDKQYNDIVNSTTTLLKSVADDFSAITNRPINTERDRINGFLRTQINAYSYMQDSDAKVEMKDSIQKGLDYLADGDADKTLAGFIQAAHNVNVQDGYQIKEFKQEDDLIYQRRVDGLPQSTYDLTRNTKRT